MALEEPTRVDAIGIEISSGHIVLTILDSWDWGDTQAHLLALQAKLNAYIAFVEEGQLQEAYPNAAGRKISIEVIGRYPLPSIASDLLERTRESVTDLGIDVRSRHIP